MLSLNAQTDQASPQDAEHRHAASGGAPRLVTRGETQADEFLDWDDSERIETRPGRNGEACPTFHPIPFDHVSPHVAHIDGLTFTVVPPSEGRAALDWLFPILVKFFGCTQMNGTGKGFNGYKDGYDLGNGAMLGIGGQAQRGTVYVSLMGAACAKVPDWGKVQMWGESVGAKITRVDLAHDDHEGRLINIEQAVQWHQEGGFKNGGRPPASETLGDWLDPGSPRGRTLNIGARGNGKMIRFYEKGKQLGDPLSPWVRAELELRAQNRVIPWDMLTRPGQYLAGAYPCLKFLSTLQNKVRTLQKAARISLNRALENLRHMGGKVVNVAMLYFVNDAAKVVEAIRREGIPGRLEPFQGVVEWASLMNSGADHVALVS